MSDEEKRKIDSDRLPSDAWEREETTDLKDSTPDLPRGMPLHTRIAIGLVVGVGAGILSYALFSVPDPSGIAGKIPHPTRSGLSTTSRSQSVNCFSVCS